jgi:hypothetical protein
MLDTYIKNRGMTKTIIHNNNHNTINETNWDADYDGSVANISLDLSKNGRNKHFDFQLNNNDLANILTIPSVRQPIHKRLKMDFKKPETFNQIFLELEPESSSSLNDIDTVFDTEAESETLNKEDIKSIPIQNILTHISSPKSNEEFIMPFHDLEEEQPVIKIIHKPSSKRHSNKSKGKSKSKSKRYNKNSKNSKKNSRRIRHHNYPSTRKSPRRSHS